MTGSTYEVVIDNLAFPESLRWHEGDLWFSDLHAGTVVRMPAGRHPPVRVLDVKPTPAGLGWLPSGDLLVVDADRRRLLRLDRSGTTTVYADLTSVLGTLANELLIDRTGRAWVGSYGYDPEADPPRSSRLAHVTATGQVLPAADGLVFPNGMDWLDDTRFVVAETFADRLAIVVVDKDGNTQVERTIDLPGGSTPDGLAVDSDGGIWVASAYGEAVLHVAPSGTVTTAISIPGVGVYDCTFGGPDGATLFVAVSDTDETDLVTRRPGAILAFHTDARGAAF